MPEPAKRVAVVGIKRAEAKFQHAVQKRVAAERTVPGLNRELADLKREADALEREASGGR